MTKKDALLAAELIKELKWAVDTYKDPSRTDVVIPFRGGEPGGDFDFDDMDNNNLRHTHFKDLRQQLREYCEKEYKRVRLEYIKILTNKLNALGVEDNTYEELGFREI